jgi:hypothetical protein
MRRREFIALVCSAAISPLEARAQPRNGAYRVGMVFLASQDVMGPHVRAFEQRLSELGYTPGKDIILTYRFAQP